MPLIGLTGGVGMGKSTVAEVLEQLDWPVIDTDAIARDLVQPGKAALREIVQVFGPEVGDEQAGLNRGALAEVAFENDANRRKLERILHPRIRQIWMDKGKRHRGWGARAGLVVIPLLFETCAEGELDGVICVSCTRETQWERLAKRGWSRDQARARIGAQWDVDLKMERADWAVWTEGAMEATRRQAERVATRVCLGDG